MAAKLDAPQVVVILRNSPNQIEITLSDSRRAKNENEHCHPSLVKCSHHGKLSDLINVR
jgi:hypothetical protein